MALHHGKFWPLGRDQGKVGGLPLLFKGRIQKLHMSLPFPVHEQNVHTWSYLAEGKLESVISYPNYSYTMLEEQNRRRGEIVFSNTVGT